MQLGMAASALPFMLGGEQAFAMQHTPVLRALASSETDRALVIIQLGGGNDGLNTVVPYRNDIYYRERPSLAIPTSDVVTLDDEMGLHPALEPLKPLWNEGRMSVVRSAGYDDATRSHFGETQSWVRGHSSDTVSSGWIGRYIAETYGDDPLDHPPAIRFGGSRGLLQRIGSVSGMSLNPSKIDQLAQSGAQFPTAGLSDGPDGSALKYVRDIANAAERFAEPVHQAYTTGSNISAYPDYYDGNRKQFAKTLATVARLMRGGLQSRIYLLSAAGGFDTHRNQAGSHAERMQEIGEVVSAFYQDLAHDGLDQRVLTMTFSEFGRTIHENGSQGTDHGAGGPMLFFGPALAGGFEGAMPDLSDPFNYGVRPTTDFRSIYRTVLEQWFDVDAAASEALLGGAYPVLDDMIDPPSDGDGGVNTTIQTIELSAGWNLVSSRVQPKNPDLSAVLANILDDVEVVEDSAGTTFTPGEEAPSLTEWDAGVAYRVYMTEPRTLEIEGLPVSPDETPIELTEGWNQVPYLLDAPMDVTVAFAALEDILTLVKDVYGRIYSPSHGINQIGTLEPGQGYRLHLDESAVFTYPTDGTTS
jgi:uncharacterized protein (DUF1501 family)